MSPRKECDARIGAGHRVGRDAKATQTAQAACANETRTLLTIAGFDPSSGAGLTADLKVFAAHGFYGVAASTALTVQSTRGVRRVEPVSAATLAEMLACLAEDLPLSGIKIGMLATGKNVQAVAEFLERLQPGDALPHSPIVLDPVLCSSSGHPLLAAEALDCLRTRLLPLVTVATPNLDELMLLAGVRPIMIEKAALDPPQARAVIEQAALALAGHLPGLGIVATGGHLDQPDDCVLWPGSPPVWLPGQWVDTPATHGTGCGYSSALLCRLVEGLTLLEAARAAKQYVSEALRAAVPRGRGGGSMHHLYAAFASRDPGYPSHQQVDGHTDHPAEEEH